MAARNRVGIGLSYRPARLHRLAEFLGSINVKKYVLRLATSKFAQYFTAHTYSSLSDQLRKVGNIFLCFDNTTPYEKVKKVW